jgi:CRP-like cAMP-binding protein
MGNIIERVDVFHDLELREVQSILSACSIKAFPAMEQVYSAGDDSSQMITLLKGQMIVVGKGGDVLGEILVGDTVGEMGLFSNRPRSANVVASVDSSGLVVDGAALEQVFQANPGLHLKVIQNALSVLCDRLGNANVHIEQLSAKVRGEPSGTSDEDQ